MKYQRKVKRTRQNPPKKRPAKRFAVGSTVLVLLAICALLFWHRNRTPPEPIKIYKTVPMSEIKQRQPSTEEEREKTDITSHIHHTDDGYYHENVAPEMSTDTIDPRPVADAAPTVSRSALEGTDAGLAEIEHQAWHIEIGKIKVKLDALNAEMAAKYPEVTKIRFLSAEDIRKRYPTQAAQTALQEKAEQMQAEFLTKISDFMVHLPMDKKIEIIASVSQNFAEKYGDETADEVTAKLMISLGL